MIRVCALMFAMVLLFTYPIVALADESTPPEIPDAPRSGAEISSMESVSIGFPSVTDSGSPPTGNKAKPQDVPEAERPPLTVNIIKAMGQWLLQVTLPKEFLIGSDSVTPYYSLDGETFIAVGSDDPVYPEILNWNNHYYHSIEAYYEPLRSYGDEGVHEFWFRVEFSGPSYTGPSQTYHIIHEPVTVPPSQIRVDTLPANTIGVGVGYKMRMRCNVTLRENSSDDVLAALLPPALPIEIAILDRNWDKLAYQMVDYPLVLLPGRQGKVIPPQGAVTIGGYPIPKLPPITLPTDANGGFVEPPLELVINTISANEKAAPQLGMYHHDRFGCDVLSLSMPYKPSGAKSIVAEYSLDGGASWLTVERTDGNDLVSLGYPPDMVPKQPDYGAPLFFDNDKTPMKEYLADNSNGFLMRLQIDGGVYDGVSEVMSWPGDYQFDPPTAMKPGSGDGGEGNRGDVGSDDDGDSALGGGQRPDLPTAGNSSETATQTKPLIKSPLMPLAKTPDPVPAQVPDMEASSAQPHPVSSAPAQYSTESSSAQPLPAASAPERDGTEQDGTENSFAPESVAEAIAAPAETPAETRRQTGKPLAVPIVSAVALLGGGVAFAGLSSASGAGGMSGFLKAIKSFFHK